MLTSVSAISYPAPPASAVWQVAWQALNKSILDFSEDGKRKCDFRFPSFSVTCGHRKWQYIPVLRALELYAEVPLRPAD
jgi:hypothetical protein